MFRWQQSTFQDQQSSPRLDGSSSRHRPKSHGQAPMIHRTLLSLGTPCPGATTLVTPQWSQWPWWPQRPSWPAQSSAAPPSPASVPDVPAHWGPRWEDVLAGGSPSSWFAGGMHGAPFLWHRGLGSPCPEGDRGKRVLRGDDWAGDPTAAMPRGWVGQGTLRWWGGICPCVSRSEWCQWEHGLGSRTRRHPRAWPRDGFAGRTWWCLGAALRLDSFILRAPRAHREALVTSSPQSPCRTVMSCRSQG